MAQSQFRNFKRILLSDSYILCNRVCGWIIIKSNNQSQQWLILYDNRIEKRTATLLRARSNDPVTQKLYPLLRSCASQQLSRGHIIPTHTHTHARVWKNQRRVEFTIPDTTHRHSPLNERIKSQMKTLTMQITRACCCTLIITSTTNDRGRRITFNKCPFKLHTHRQTRYCLSASARIYVCIVGVSEGISVIPLSCITRETSASTSARDLILHALRARW